MNPIPPPLEELKKLRPPVQNINLNQRRRLSVLEKLAVWITQHVGTMGFFLIIFLWTLIWFGWNTLAPQKLRFDPFPAFVLWLFVSNVVQIFLLPLIMLGQNLQARHAEARAEADFEVNMRSEREIEAVLMHLENQNRVVSEILRKLEAGEQKNIGGIFREEKFPERH